MESGRSNQVRINGLRMVTTENIEQNHIQSREIV